MLASLKALRQVDRILGNKEVLLPTAGHVLLGVGPLLPAEDHTYSPRPDKTGLHREIRNRRLRGRTCKCRIEAGTRWYCERCSRFGLEHMDLPGMPIPKEVEGVDRADEDHRTEVAVGAPGGLKGGLGG